MVHIIRSTAIQFYSTNFAGWMEEDYACCTGTSELDCYSSRSKGIM